MAEITKEALEYSMDLLQGYDETLMEKIFELESEADQFEDHLGQYLVKLSSRDHSVKDSAALSMLFHCIGDMERISDHAVNIADLGKELAEKKIRFSDKARQELKTCVDAVLEIMDLTQRAMETDDLNLARMVEPLEETIDRLVKKCTNRHIQRVQEGNCTLELGFVFNDSLHNMERVADHCSNLAISVLENAISTVHGHDYLRSLRESGDDQYEVLLAGYTAKYSID